MITNVIEYLEESASEYPNKIAFVDDKKNITFSQLKEQAQKLAFKLIENKIGIMQPVVIALEKSVDCMVAFFAVIYSGNFYVPIDIHAPDKRISKIFEKLNPKGVITYSNEFEKWSNFGVNLFDVGNCNNEIQLTDEEEIMLKNILNQHIDVSPLYVLFTSGSTGMPKGVTISHRSMIDYGEWLSDTFNFTSETIFGNQAPVYFDNSILDIYSTLKHGATTVFLPEKLFAQPKKLLNLMEEQKVNTIFWVPSAMGLISNRKNILPTDNLNLEKILFCGEVMPVKTLNKWKEFFPNSYFANLYGPTEITDVCCYYEVNRVFTEDESLPIGKPCKNTSILILDEDNKVSKLGELCVRGSGLALGYYNDTEKTQQVFTQNPLHNLYEDKIYRTGDIVKLNKLDEIIYIGRKDQQIKHMGYRIELGEIEQSCNTIDEVVENCVVYHDEKIIMFASIVDVSKTGNIEKVIYQKLKLSVPSYMLPTRIFIVDVISHTPNGKIDRNAMKQKYLI